MKHILPFITAFYLLSSCAVNKGIKKQAGLLLNDSAIATGHMGISIYEPATGRYWYNYNADHYFIPASNTKLFTLYAGMKYLGDSLVGLRYTFLDRSTLAIFPAGDPTLLHADFTNQPVFTFLINNSAAYKSLAVADTAWKENPLGYGWAWDDYNDEYMVERSALPVFGNVIKVELRDPKEIDSDIQAIKLSGNSVAPPLYDISIFNTTPSFFDSAVDILNISALTDKNDRFVSPKIKIIRSRDKNSFSFEKSPSVFKSAIIPFVTKQEYGYSTGSSVLSHLLQKDELIFSFLNPKDSIIGFTEKQNLSGHPLLFKYRSINTIHSQPSDSLFKPMMHRSDNFFAEQTLLMASNEFLGYMNDEQMIDTILNSSLKDVPQKPRWVDGSGLSRYNLFTPKSFVYILSKMKDEFGLNRMKLILATGGEGTLSSYYKNMAGFIYAKTGTLSNNCALSGYLITHKGKLLIFSILNNNYITGATPVRRAVERFLTQLAEKN